MKKAFLIIFFALGSLLPSASEVQAEGFVSITPVVIDAKARARDILPYSVTIKNTSDRKITVYTFVNNINPESGKKEFVDRGVANLSDSLANWIMIPRAGAELEAGEEKKIDFKIEVNLNAAPAIYHAAIVFSEGSNRGEAELKMNSAPSLAVNLEVSKDIKEHLQVKRFVAGRKVSIRFPVDFSYELENAGNEPLTPRGELIIYNRNGKEVSAVKINAEEKILDPGESSIFGGSWSEGSGFGRYKAFLSLEYGRAGGGKVQDTIFFWILPWYILGLIFIGVLGTVMLLAWLIHRRYEKWHTVRLISEAPLAPPPLPQQKKFFTKRAINRSDPKVVDIKISEK